MGSFARCIHCGTDDVEYTGTTQYELDEYYCHSCEKYFQIDWDKQDEIEESNIEFQGYEDEDDEDVENEWENEGGRCET